MTPSSEGLRRHEDKAKPILATGKFLPEWLRFNQRFPSLYKLEGKEGHVKRAEKPAIHEVKSEFEGYRVVFSNQGRLRKFNPNPLNHELLARPFEKCLVADCPNATKNMYGLCSEAKHMIWGEIKVREGRKTSMREDWVEMTRLEHLVDWMGVLLESESGRRIQAPEHSGIAEVLLKWVGDSEARGKVADEFVRDLLKNQLIGKVKDSTTMQLETEFGEDPALEVLEKIEGCVNSHFEGVDDGVNWSRRVEGEFTQIPIKAIAATMGLAFAAEEANRNDLWFMTEVLGRGRDDSKYASAYMSAVYFLLRREGATPKQARMSQRTM